MGERANSLARGLKTSQIEPKLPFLDFFITISLTKCSPFLPTHRITNSENSVSATKKLTLLPLKHFRSPALSQAFYFYIPYGTKQIEIV